MRDKIAYAAGDFGCNMSFALKGTVQTFWLVYMMMETGLLSILLLLVQIWDAVNDPLIGSMIDADRRKYKMGKFKTYIFIGACGLLVGGVAVSLNWTTEEVIFYGAATLLASMGIVSVELSDAVKMYRLFLVLLTGFFPRFGFFVGLILILLSIFTTPVFGKKSYFWPLKAADLAVFPQSGR